MAIFKNPWSGPYAFITFGLVLWVLSLLLTWHASSQRQLYSDVAAAQAGVASANVNSKYLQCFENSSELAIINCIEILAATKRAEQRAEQALAAEREIAYWSPWMLLTSAMASVAAVSGVLYVAFTLREMRRTNKIAHGHFLASQRPWVSIEPHIASDLVFNETEGRITIAFELKNYGTSPATNVVVESKIIPGAFDGWAELEKMHDRARVRAAPQKMGHNLFPGESFVYSVSLPISRGDIDTLARKFDVPVMKMIPAQLAACAIYLSPIEHQKHMTDVVVNLFRKDPERPEIALMLNTEEGVTKMRELKLERSFGSGQAR